MSKSSVLFCTRKHKQHRWFTVLADAARLLDLGAWTKRETFAAKIADYEQLREQAIHLLAEYSRRRSLSALLFTVPRASHDLHGLARNEGLCKSKVIRRSVVQAKAS
jgi:hypothetical protein